MRLQADSLRAWVIVNIPVPPLFRQTLIDTGKQCELTSSESPAHSSLAGEATAARSSTCTSTAKHSHAADLGRVTAHPGSP
jgi:hypothetical protein